MDLNPEDISRYPHARRVHHPHLAGESDERSRQDGERHQALTELNVSIS